MTNHVDCFSAAVTVLAGDGHIKQRLIRAFTENLAEIDDAELPDPLKQKFQATRERMHSVAPLNGEGHIRATVRKMSARDASECARDLLSIYTDILTQGREEKTTASKTRRPRLVKSASA